MANNRAHIDLHQWLENERRIACDRLLRNISPSDAARGAVVASPSRNNPDYYYHWIRDAALVMDTVVTLYERESGPRKNYYFNLMMDYWFFSMSNQKANTLSGLGEPKFYVDGTAYEKPWGRPQNDGPALRALTLIRMSRALNKAGYNSLAQAMYWGSDRSPSVIKTDLELVSHHWQDMSFDLWEEVEGHHFYTRMVQRKALIEGAALANLWGDQGAEQWYSQQSAQISSQILRHWNSTLQLIDVSLERKPGQLTNKTSGLDISTMLASLHTSNEDGFFSVTDDRIIATVQKLITEFSKEYKINSNGAAGTAMGRYPHDTYYGGNPWILATTGTAEFCFKLVQGLKRLGAIQISSENRDFYSSLFSNDTSTQLQIIAGLHIKIGRASCRERV